MVLQGQLSGDDFMHVLTAVVLTTCTLGGAPSGEVLNFSAKWCGPCRQMGPIVDRLNRQGLPIRKIDVDQNPELVRKYGIGPIPAFVLVINGQVVQKVEGAQPEQNLRQMLARIPPSAPANPGPVVDSTIMAQSQPPSSNLPSAPFWKPAPTGKPTPPPKQGIFGSPFAGLTKPATQPGAADFPAKVRGNIGDPDAPLQQGDTASNDPMRVSVRIRVIDAEGTNFGSGTIIESKLGHTLILTCGHVFRNWQEKSLVEVDLFQDGKHTTVVGKHERHDLKVDLGLISISTDAPLPYAVIAPQGDSVTRGAAATSVGCGEGNDPTQQRHLITRVDGYRGPSNLIECTGVPIQGRSGGGLFNKSGEVIGVCMAADEQGKRGLYVGWKAINQFVTGKLTPVQELPQDEALVADAHETDSDEIAPPAKRKSRGIAALQEALGEDADGVVCLIKSDRDDLAARRIVILKRQQPNSQLANRATGTSRLQPTSLQR